MGGFGFRTNTAFEWNGAQFRIERLQPNGAVLLERQDNGELSIVTREALLTAYGNREISVGRAPCVRIVVASLESQQWAAIKDGNGKVLREVQR